MSNEMTVAQLSSEEITRLSKLSNADLVRWAETDGGPRVGTTNLSDKERSRLIRRIRLSNRLVVADGYLIWVDANEA